MLEVTSAFFLMAKAQNRKLNHATGVIVFPYEKKELPQDVLFFPFKHIDEKNLRQFITDKLSDSASLGYVTYFQAIRWIQPDVLDELLSTEYIDGELNLFLFPTKKVRIIIGTIVFDSTLIIAEENYVHDTTIKELKISIGSGIYPFHFRELPRTMGIPKYFEKLSQ